ncbi:MAG: serine/threonine-protein kinase [Pirellulales bacterium]
MQPSDTSQSGGAGAPDIRATVTAALEGSFAAGHRPRVEEWLPRFPQLATDPSLLLSLVETEYRLRRHYTGLDDTQEYEQRFAAWWPELSTRLAGIRSELLAETLPRIAGYEVQETLGRGGFGRVYRARQMSLRREVAIKVLRTSDADDPQLVQRFISEAAILARLSHSQVVQVYEAGLTHDKQPFMAMELVEGGNLRRRLAAGPLPAADAARLIQQLAAAVEYLHRQGVIHRDLKPENVLLTAEGTPKVADFGLARHVEASLRCTQTGDVLGTLMYASPEQLRGESSRVDARSDVYSLGVMLYELLAGHRPYEATQLAGLLEKITQETPAPLRDIPRDLETICAKCLQIVPAARYGSAQELADDLDRYLQGARIVGRRPSRVARLIRSARQHPARLVTAALVTLLVMGMGSYRIWNWLQYERLTVSYFKSGTNRWQVVHGVDPISEAVARTRYSSVRITRRGRQGPIVRADLVDGFLRPHPLDTLVTASVKGVTDSPDEQIVTVEYPERLESGYITRFVARNRNGEEVWRFLFYRRPLLWLLQPGGRPHGFATLGACDAVVAGKFARHLGEVQLSPGWQWAGDSTRVLRSAVESAAVK